MKAKNLLIIFLVLWYSRCFSYLDFPLDITTQGWISRLIEIGIICLFFIHKSDFHKSDAHFITPLKYLIFATILGLVPAVVVFNQTIFKGITTLMPTSILCLYFLFHIYKYEKKDLEFIILACGISYCIIHIAEQFTYPFMPFCEEGRIYDNGDVEQRNGLWRILMQGRELSVLMTYLFFYKFCREKKMWTAIIALMGVASIYLNLGRMWTAQCLVSLFIIYMLANNRKFNIRYIIVLLLGIVIYNNIGGIIGTDMVEFTSENMQEDYIRWVAYDYFWTESIKDPFVFVLGHGPISGTVAGSIVSSLAENQGLYTWDVGVVGILFEKGLLYVIALVYYYIYVIKRSKNVVWVFAYLVPVALFTIMMPSMHTVGPHIQACVYLYWADLELKEKQQLEEITV